MHTRKAIRDAIVAAVTGLTTTGTNVYVSRVYPMERRALPGIAVFTRSEDSTPVTVRPPRTIERELTVALEIYTRGIDGYDDVLDTICTEIEEALYAAGDLGGLVKDLYINGVDMNFQDGSEQPLASCDMEVRVMYTTTEGSPTI